MLSFFKKTNLVGILSRPFFVHERRNAPVANPLLMNKTFILRVTIPFRDDFGIGYNFVLHLDCFCDKTHL